MKTNEAMYVHNSKNTQMEKEEEDSQCIVASALHVKDFAKPTLMRVVHERSVSESFGNAVFTLMLLTHFESGQTFTKQHLSQSCIGACMRAVCSRAEGRQPDPVDYEHLDVQEAIRVAQGYVMAKMTSFCDDSGLTQTFNQSALRYETVLKNNLVMRLPSWQKRTLRAELRKPGSPHRTTSKKTVNFIINCNAISSAINSAEAIDQSKYKSDDIKNYDLNADIYCQSSIADHRPLIAYDGPTKDKFLGVMSKVKGKPHLFLSYALFLQRRTETLEQLVIEEDKRDAAASLDTLLMKEPVQNTIEKKRAKVLRMEHSRPKAPFQVIPQLTMKLRFVSFGKEQITELVTALSRDPTLYDDKAVSTHISELFADVKMPIVAEKRNLQQLSRSEKLWTLKAHHVLELEKLAMIQREKLEAKEQKVKVQLDTSIVKLETANAKRVLMIEEKQDKFDREEHKQTQHAIATDRKRNELEEKLCKLEKVHMHVLEMSKPVVKRTKKQEDTNQKKFDSRVKKINACKLELDPIDKTPNRGTWRAVVDIVASRLFDAPKHVLGRGWTGVVTTDGIRANWHCKVPGPPKQKKDHKKRRKMEKQIVCCRELKPTHYGTHKQDYLSEEYQHYSC